MASPRPLAGLPAADPRELAQAWLLRRIAAAPLEAAAELAGPRFVAGAPGLCGSLLAALGDDAALGALTREDDGLLSVLAPCPAQTIVEAGEQLRAATAEVLLPRLDPALAAPLHDRLAHACAVLVAQAVEEAASPTDTITAHDTRARTPRDPRERLTAEAERLVVAGLAFTLLALEIEDAGVLPAGVLTRAEAAVRTGLPSGALDAPDGPGSLLVLARDEDGRELARRLLRAVAGSGSHRGAPLRAAAGIAEHPRDGDTPETLLAHADGQLFTARADGLPLA